MDYNGLAGRCFPVALIIPPFVYMADEIIYDVTNNKYEKI